MKVKRLLNKSLIFALCLVIILGNILIKHGFTGVSDTDSAYAGKSDGSAIEIRVFEENGFTTKVTNTGEKKIINVPFIYQSDNYKTACESLSAVMALQYYNQNISPETFINNYLDKGSYESFDPNVCFGGDPCGSGMGCYAPVITKAVNKYVNKTGAKLSATTVQGQTLTICAHSISIKIYLLFCGQQQICRRRSTGAKFLTVTAIYSG